MSESKKFRKLPTRNFLILFSFVLTPACAYKPISLPEQSLHQPVAKEQEPENWQELLPQQLERVRSSVVKWRDYKAARKAGWRKFGDEEPLMGQHYYNLDEPDYVAGDKLDFSRPNNLMYAEIDGDLVLTGVAFVVRIGRDEYPPAGFAGPTDKWHVHDFLDSLNAATEGRPFLRFLVKQYLDNNYLDKGDDRYRLAMVHVWTENENPDGIFADYDRTLAYRKLSLPLEWSDGASLEAAQGLFLVTEKGCRNTIRGKAWVAGLSWKQTRNLMAACERTAERIENVLTTDAETVNKTAESAWNDFEVFRKSVLTDEQHARMKSMVEHNHEHHH